MQTAGSDSRRRTRLIVAASACGLGVLAWAAAAAGGDFRGGLIAFVIMAAYGLLLVVLGGRSDVVSVLAGSPRDERYSAIDIQAVAVTGFVLILYVIAGFLWEQAHGRSGMPFTLMGAAAGVSYIGAVVYGRLRG